MGRDSDEIILIHHGHIWIAYGIAGAMWSGSVPRLRRDEYLTAVYCTSPPSRHGMSQNVLLCCGFLCSSLGGYAEIPAFGVSHKHVEACLVDDRALQDGSCRGTGQAIRVEQHRCLGEIGGIDGADGAIVKLFQAVEVGRNGVDLAQAGDVYGPKQFPEIKTMRRFLGIG